MSIQSRCAVIAMTILVAGASTPAQAQWTVHYTVRYEAAGQLAGRPGERRGPDTLVSETNQWQVQQEARGTLAYTEKVLGAVASRMADANNEQRYDSWLHRPGSAGKPVALMIDGEEVVDRAAKLGQADGEGAIEINRQRAGKFGRVEHQRTRVAISADGETAGRMAGAFLQIDRVDGKLHFEPPALEIDPAQVRYAVEKVVRMDRPAGPGEWDVSDAKDGAQRTRALSLPQLPVQVFDLPRDAETFDAIRTVDVSGRIGGKAIITIALRRGGPVGAHAAAAPTGRSGGGTSVAATAIPNAPQARAAAEPCPARAGASGQSDAATTGADVGGKVLGGGHGRQVGAAIGGFLGALSGATKKTEPAPECAR